MAIWLDHASFDATDGKHTARDYAMQCIQICIDMFDLAENDAGNARMMAEVRDEFEAIDRRLFGLDEDEDGRYTEVMRFREVCRCFVSRLYGEIGMCGSMDKIRVYYGDWISLVHGD